MKAVPLVVGAIFALAVPLVALGVYQAMPRSPDHDVEARAAASALTDEVAALRTEVDDLKAQQARMAEELDALKAPVVTASAVPTDNPAEPTGPDPLQGAYDAEVLIVDRKAINQETEVPTPAFLEGLLGRPRAVLTDNCDPMENPKLLSMLVTADVGHFQVHMLQPAVDSLQRVFVKIRDIDPVLYDSIGTAGSLCVRRIRGTTDRTSSHSFGTAVDLTIGGRTDGFADGGTQVGLTMLQDVFRSEGWAWGAGFGREDSMHFEVSRKTLEEWRAEGKI